MQELHRHVTTARLSAERIDELGTQIAHAFRGSAAHLQDPDFEAIAAADLERLFLQYDALFFGGQLGPLTRQAGHSLTFRTSARMTSAGGKTYRRVRRRLAGPARVEYEIAISSVLLAQSFPGRSGEPEEPHRTMVSVGGLECRTRLDALQRILEHELIHLVELLVWDRTSCSRDRFASMVHRLFGHTACSHQLITPREVAREKYQVGVGDLVHFDDRDGRTLTGRVNRITRRATVLVPDARGQLYSDGQRYAKFYVPLSQLQPANARPATEGPAGA